MKVGTAELAGPALDWAVAKCEGRGLQRNPMGAQGGHGWWVWEETPSGRGGVLIDKSVYMEIGPYTKPKTRNSSDRYSPSTDWAQGGPIIEQEFIQLADPCTNMGHEWRAWCGAWNYCGTTALIAICRCYVASKLGDEVDVPEELL